MKKRMQNTEAIESLASRIAFPQDKMSLLIQALTHPAYYEGSQHEEGDNQRLEFLGDAVLDLFVGEYLYYQYPQASEGVLSKMRAFIVCENSLAEDAIALGVDQSIRLGRGSEAGGDRHRPSVLADAYEAVLGAMYVACGADATRKLIVSRFAEKMNTITADDYEDKKSLLQEIVQARVPHGVSYKLHSSSGPDHAPTFESGVYAGKILLGKGIGRSKKESEVAAAVDALACRVEWLDKIK